MPSINQHKQSFQDHMPGNICFGCGKQNPNGLQIDSYWEGEEAVCTWQSEEKYQGWKGLMSGGVIATLIDCHAMGTAMAAAHRAEDRPLGSLPEYRYATGTMNIKYLLPTSNIAPIQIRATVQEIKGKKTTISCKVFSEGKLTVVADVIAIRVYDSSKMDNNSHFKG